MEQPPRILFLPASGEGVGGGHVLRGLALAAALQKRGARCLFSAGPEGLRLLKRFGGELGLQTLPRDRPLSALAELCSADAVVIDDYRLGAGDEEGLASASQVLVAIDDLADRAHLAELLIDPSYGRWEADYEALLPAGARALAGPAYALLRPEFADAAPVEIGPRVQRVFVGFGLADPGGITARAVLALLPALPNAAFDVVLGAGSPSLVSLKALAAEHPKLSLHVETTRTAALMAAADMAVGAGGASTWERAVLGLPSLCIAVADNQRALTRDLAQAGVHLALDADEPGFDNALPEAVRRVVEDRSLREALAAAGKKLCDGGGAGRVAQAILEAVAARRSEEGG